MADGVVVRTNIPAFKKQMEKFGFDLERRIFRSAVAAGSLVFRKEVEKNAPVYHGPRRRGRIAGTLKRNILMKRLRVPKGQEHYYVGVRGGTAGGGSRGGGNRRGGPGQAGPAFMFLPFYWWWVEAGHRKIPRGQKITGGRRLKALRRQRFDARGGGRTRAVEYIARAYEQQKQPALAAFIARVEQRIKKENAKRTPR